MEGSSCQSFNISVTLRFGGNTRLLTVERSADPQALENFKLAALRLADKSESPTNQVILFRHDYLSPQVLQPLQSLSQLTNGSVVEVIIVDEQQPTIPHSLALTSYRTPTFCDYCGEFLVGLLKQGVQCQHCRQNFHKKCAMASRNNCASTGVSGVVQGGVPPLPPSTSFSIPHTLAVHNFKTLTVCRVCDKMLLGIIKQGFRCRDCQVAVHKKCAPLLEQNCQLAEHAITPNLERLSMAEEGTVPSDPQPMDTEDSMIPLARLPGQAAGSRARPSMEGWMLHFELSDPERRLRHYWILANDAINLYAEYGGEITGVNRNRVYRTIPLAEILAVSRYEGPPVDDRFPSHAFEIRTIAGTVYCVGDQWSGNGPPAKMARQLSRGTNASATQWLQALIVALQPPASRTDADNAEPALQLSQLYQVLSEQTLGSGQFGTVYAGIHRQSGREVAVKVISKERFSKRSAGAESLKTEVGILQSISHPGIVTLESMYETHDKIFVVMEKLHGDMLEMILSQECGRLNERITKFLIWQILCALRYLHNKEIAHCDLKPENVLLSQQGTQFPQTKLCDFGYARVIGERQFRKTIVGTPAYLPPEVLQKKGYNKSLDMWSVGVIIYVTLSGTFPFNDGEEVQDQIENAAFMFPKEIWKNISQDSIDLIQRLLRVQIEDRLTIEESMVHRWLQCQSLYSDLNALEHRVGIRYLTEGSPSSVPPPVDTLPSSSTLIDFS